MPRNDIQSLPPLALAAFNQHLGAKINELYNVPKTQTDKLDSTTALLVVANQRVDDAKSAYRAAIRDREAAKRTAADAAAQVAKTVYAVPTNTPGMIAAVGLSPRSTSRAKIVPTVPQRLTATPNTDGSVRLEWDRNGNGTGVNFLVETRLLGAEWTFLGDTTATKTLLAGYAPGAPVAFRVVASKNGTQSAPSSEATIYAAEASGLRLAA